jgi:hypothetical protein
MLFFINKIHVICEIKHKRSFPDKSVIYSNNSVLFKKSHLIFSGIDRYYLQKIKTFFLILNLCINIHLKILN